MRVVHGRHTAAFSFLLNLRSYGRLSNSGAGANFAVVPDFDLGLDGPAMIDRGSAAFAVPSAVNDKCGVGSFVMAISGIGLTTSVIACT